jgi:hypothetical protein
MAQRMAFAEAAKLKPGAAFGGVPFARRWHHLAMRTCTFWRRARVVGGLSLGLLPLSGFGQTPTWQWVAAQTNSTNPNATIRALATDGSGATVVGGSFTGSITLGSTTLSSAGRSDAFVAWLSPGGLWTQALRAGGSADETIRALSLDGAGGVAVCGEFNSPSLSFGATTLSNVDPSGSSADVFLARLSSAGSWTQAVQAGGSANDYANALALAADGTATVAGFFISPSLSCGANTLSNADPAATSADVFVARLSSAGVWTQAVRAGGGSGDGATALALDAAGNATVAGAFSSNTASFGTFSLSNADPNGRSDDVFVARLSSAGTWTQVARAGTLGFEFANGLALDGNGDATVVGAFFSPQVSFGSSTLNNANSSGSSTDGFVARLSSAGVWTQATRLGGSSDDEATAVALDGSGNATVTGCFRSPVLSLGSTTLTNANASGQSGDVFVARLSPTGSWAQALRAGSSGHDNAYALALNGGTATVAGVAAGPTASFGSLSVSTGAGSVFVARLAGLPTATTPARNDGLSLYPNPAQTITTLTGALAGTTVRVFDALGRPVATARADAHGAATLRLPAGLAPGLYIVRAGAQAQRLLRE